MSQSIQDDPDTDEFIKKFMKTDHTESHTPIVDKYEHIDNVTTNGITKEEYDKVSLDVQTSLRQCQYCSLIFKSEMMLSWDENITCLHCFFWTHYDEALRDKADGGYGCTVAEYIERCKVDHDYSACMNSSRFGYCFICDYANGDLFNWIKNREMVFKDDQTDNKSDNIIHDNTYSPEIEIEI